MNAISSGYSKSSIIIHWVTAIAVVALFVTHEGDRGSTAYAFHVGVGAIVGIFLLWRVWRRIALGSATKTDQHPALNLLSDIVRWGLLLAIAGVVLTGYFVPWSIGQSINVMGLFDLPSPLPRSRSVHEFFEEIHEFFGHILIPLTLLHIAGVIKHTFVDKDKLLRRMITPMNGGK